MLFPSKVKRSCCNEDACCNNGGVTAKAFKALSDEVGGLELRVETLETEGLTKFEEVPAEYDGTYGYVIEPDKVKNGLYIFSYEGSDSADAYSLMVMYDGEEAINVKGSGTFKFSTNIFDVIYLNAMLYDDTVPAYEGKLCLMPKRIYYSSGAWHLGNSLPSEGVTIYRLAD